MIYVVLYLLAPGKIIKIIIVAPPKKDQFSKPSCQLFATLNFPATLETYQKYHKLCAH